VVRVPASVASEQALIEERIEKESRRVQVAAAKQAKAAQDKLLASHEEEIQRLHEQVLYVRFRALTVAMC
jgi:hypothetical protein